jgi:hypothetical protein
MAQGGGGRHRIPISAAAVEETRALGEPITKLKSARQRSGPVHDLHFFTHTRHTTRSWLVVVFRDSTLFRIYSTLNLPSYHCLIQP